MIEKTFRQMRAFMRKEEAKVVHVTDDIDIYVGNGVVDSKWHFDWFAVELSGIWFHDKKNNRWGYSRDNEHGWQWFGEDEVTVPKFFWKCLDAEKKGA